MPINLYVIQIHLQFNSYLYHTNQKILQKILFSFSFNLTIFPLYQLLLILVFTSYAILGVINHPQSIMPFRILSFQCINPYLYQ